MNQTEPSELGYNHQPEAISDARKAAAAWGLYVQLGSEVYSKANSERTKTGEIKVSYLGEADHRIALVAQIRVDKVGNAVSGHEFDPNAESNKDIEAEFSRYIQQTPKDQQFVIAEGLMQPEICVDRDDAITMRSDSGLTQWLAGQKGVPITSGEPADEEITAELAGQGVGQADLATHYIVRGFASGQLRQAGWQERIGGSMYYAAAQAGLDGFRLFGEQEKQAIRARGDDGSVMQAIETAAESLVPAVNEAVRDQLGGDLLEVGVGQIQLAIPNVDIANLEAALLSMVDPTRDGELSRIGKLVSTARDKAVYNKILDAYRSGKSPFVVYGGSHIVCIEPALQAYFDSETA